MNPLIEAGVILVCLLAVIAGGHYWQDEIEAKRKVVQTEAIQQPPVEVEQYKPHLDFSKFEVAAKRTE